VLSLDEARAHIEFDHALPETSRTHALEVIDHITSNAMTVSNDQRKAITIG
jgi:hypothetical protein